MPDPIQAESSGSTETETSVPRAFNPLANTPVGGNRPYSKLRSPKKKQRRIVHENSVLLMSLAGGILSLVIALIMLWTGDYSPKTQWTGTIFMVIAWLSCGFAVRGMVVRPLQTLANMHAAIREGDFSMRARFAGQFDALSMLMFEINALTEAMREEKLGALEAGALLNKVMSEIDVAIFAFDSEHKLRVVNRAGERLMARHTERLLGSSAEDLGLAEALDGPVAQTLEKAFPGGSGRWGVRRSTFRQGGVPHQLVVMADLSRALREEERQAWQRLVRVLGHELNNSLAPIRSIADSLEMIMKRQPRPDDWEDDVRRGLRVVADRSEALSRFMRDYARLTRLPQPQPQKVPLAPLILRIAGLEQRLPVTVVPGPAVTIEADPDQLEQVLINLIRNAVDASLEAAANTGLPPNAAQSVVANALTGGSAGSQAGNVNAGTQRPSGGTALQPGGDSGGLQPAGGSSGLQPTGGSTGLQPTGGNIGLQATGGNTGLQASGYGDQKEQGFSPGVRVSWEKSGASVEIMVEDNGPGVANPSNLFVPFFTTKPGGSGIGLALSRQIAEAHGGTVFLRNRADTHGCEAHVVLPIRQFAEA